MKGQIQYQQHHREAKADPEYRAQQQQVSDVRCQRVCACEQANLGAHNYVMHARAVGGAMMLT